MQISRIRLSDKTSRLHPRRAATKLDQAYEPEVLVKVREWIAAALASSGEAADSVTRESEGRSRLSLLCPVRQSMDASRRKMISAGVDGMDARIYPAR